MTRLAIDAMGGDHAPGVVIEGAVRAAQSYPDLELTLVGQELRIRDELSRAGADPERFQIVNASQTIEMHESPIAALRQKPDSSIRRMMRLLREKSCDAVFSAGNTGAMVAAASIQLGLLPGARRAGIAVAIPTNEKPVVLMDVGANVQCRPVHLVQYGIMASQYVSRVFGIEDPTVGLLNVGEEDQKGNRLAKETNELFRSTKLRYVGNVEGRDIFRGVCNAVVCDGFVGNIVLKVAEGLWERVYELLVGEVKAAGATAAAAEMRKVLGELGMRLDYSEYGGAPLLGVNGTVIIGHGRSSAKAIASAVRWAREMLKARVTEHILETLGDVDLPAGDGDDER